MTDLIKRLQEAEEGGRELDALIWAHTHPEPVRVLDWNECYGDTARTQVRFKVLPGRRENVTSARGPYPHAEPFTTSTDAAVALAERLGWRVRVMDASIKGRFSWCLESLDPRPGVDHETGATMIGTDFQYGFGATLATALCAAILKAVDTGRE